ncbi:Vacuolar protein sorting-associated protein 62 [Phlyctochytrium planicorne]|nr:Vacuolar protein sorting-associated protein 62 [Phlyctochytrium planicorne]
MLFAFKHLILCLELVASATAATPPAHRSRNVKRDVPVPPEYDQLARTYAPLVKFHSSEQYFSTSVDYILSQPKVYLQDGNGNRAPNQPQLNTSNLDYLQKQGIDDTNYYLWVDGDVAADPNLPADLGFLKGSSNMNPAPMHFSPYNLGKSTPLGRIDDHVGDWERFIVRTVNGQATALDFYTHGGQGVRVVPLNDKRVQWVGTHPVVYTALGSHGMWPQAGKNTYKTVVLVYDLVDETSDGGAQWNTWESLSTIMYQQNGGYTGSNSFLNFRGRYGNKGDNSCSYYDEVGSCKLATGPVGPNRNFAGPFGEVLATNGGDISRITFYLDPWLANRAADQGLGFVAVHIHCPGTTLFGDNGDVERWGVVAFQGRDNLQYTITTDRCRTGRSRYVKNYELAFCTANDYNTCTRKSGNERALKVFDNGSQIKPLGVIAADLDPWSWAV